MDRYQALANAVVEQAAKDYMSAMRALKRNPKNENAAKDIVVLEKFFHSDWYTMLTEVDGEYLIRKIKEVVK